MFRNFRKEIKKEEKNMKTLFELNDKFLETNKPIIIHKGKLVGYGKKE